MAIAEETGESTRASKRPALVASGIVAVAALAMLPAIRGGFFSDDSIYVTENRTLFAIPLSRAWRIFVEKTNPWEYLPVRDLSYRIDAALFGISAVPFHLVNVALYAAACAACFLAARSVVRALRAERGDLREQAIVLGAVAVFALHPAHVESVAWISSRKDLLSGAFALLALWQFAEAISPERPDRRRIVASAAAFSLGLLSKASVIPLAPVALLLALARPRTEPLRKSLPRALAVSAPFIVLAAASIAVASGYTSVGRVSAEFDTFRPVSTPELALRILGAETHIALAPVRLRLQYEVRLPGPAGLALLLAGVATALATAAGCWAAVRRRSVAGFGLALYGIFLVPFLQIVKTNTGSEAHERWLFVPIFGLALAAGGLLAWLAERRGTRAAVAAGLAFAAPALALAAGRAAEWGDPQRFAEVNFERAPTHPDAVTNAMAAWAPDLRFAEARAAVSRLEASAYRERLLLVVDGWQALAEGRPADAVRAVERLSSLTSVSSSAMLEGALAERVGRDFDAIRFYSTLYSPGQMLRIQERHRPEVEALREAASRNPGKPSLLAALGNLQSELYLNAEAAGTYRRLLLAVGDAAPVHYNLAMVLRRERDFEGAAAEYRLAARGMPGANAWNELGLCETELGHVDEAVRAFRAALEADPLAWIPAFNLARTWLAAGRRSEARDALLVARGRALAAGGPLAQIDVLLDRVGR